LTVIFSDGFESGDFSEWTATENSAGDTTTVVTTLPHHGTYHGKFTTDASGTNEYADCYHTLASSASVLNVRGYFAAVTALPSEGNFYMVISADGSGFIAGAVIRTVSGVTNWWLRYRDGLDIYFVDTGIAVALNTYYCVELESIVDGVNGEARLYINGVEEAEVTSKDTNNYGNIATLYIGEATSTGQTAHSIYVDCVVVADAYIGFEYTTYTKTFSVGANLTDNFTKTFSANANLLKSLTKTFSANANLLQSLTKTFSANGNLTSTLTKELTVNGSLLANLTKTFTVNGNLLGSFTKEFTVNSSLIQNLTKTFSFNGSLLDNFAKEFTVNANLKQTLTRTFTFNAELTSVNIVLFSYNSQLLENLTKEFTLNAYLTEKLAPPYIPGGLIKRKRLTPFERDLLMLTVDLILQKQKFERRIET
jgi:hypothetical protein